MIHTDEALRQALSRGSCALELAAGEETWEVVNARVTSSCCGEALTVGAVSAAQLMATVVGQGIGCGDDVTLTAITEGQRLPLGTYKVAESKAEEGRTALTAYDAAFDALNGIYVPNASTPPATALAVLGDLCSQCGLTLGAVTNLTDQSVSGDLSGRTCKSMAGYMAGLLGCNVVVDRGGNLALRGFAAGRSITPAEYYSGSLRLDAEQALTGIRMVKKLVTSTTDSDGITTQEEQQTVYQAGEGIGMVMEVENPYATQSAVNDVWTALHGSITTYRTGSCTFFGGLETEPGDVVTITDQAGDVCAFPALTVTLELDGGCRCTVESRGESETALTAGVEGSYGRLLSRLAADLGDFKELTVGNFTATKSKIDNLWADNAWVQHLFAQNVNATHLNVTGDSKVGPFEVFTDGRTGHYGLLGEILEQNAYLTVMAHQGIELVPGSHMEVYRYLTENGSTPGFRISSVVTKEMLQQSTIHPGLASDMGLLGVDYDRQMQYGNRALLLLRHEPLDGSGAATETIIAADSASLGGDLSVAGNLTASNVLPGAYTMVRHSGGTATIAMNNDFLVLAMERASNALVTVSYEGTGCSVLAGTMDSRITVTKSANSKTATITNGSGMGLRVMVLGGTVR